MMQQVKMIFQVFWQHKNIHIAFNYSIIRIVIIIQFSQLVARMKHPEGK